jgi:hypothetical protein
MPYVDQHTVLVDVPPDRAWDVVSHLGGDARFWTPQPLWRARGAVDRAIGGPGFRITGPGRALEVGDAVDFWEVVAVRPPARLTLRAATRLPGTVDLDVLVHPAGARTELGLRTTFEPAGTAGHAYWWSTVAAHRLTFERMTRRLATLVTSA